MAKKTTKKEKADRISLEKLEKNVDSFDKKMNEVRREYIQKSSNSKKSAADLVLTS
jgi:hypothetical protein